MLSVLKQIIPTVIVSLLITCNPTGSADESITASIDGNSVKMTNNTNL